MPEDRSTTEHDGNRRCCSADSTTGPTAPCCLPATTTSPTISLSSNQPARQSTVSSPLMASSASSPRAYYRDMPSSASLSQRRIVNIDDIDDDDEEEDGELEHPTHAKAEYLPSNISNINRSSLDLTDASEEPTPSPLRAALADFYFTDVGSPSSPNSPYFAHHDMIGTIEEESETGSPISSKRSSRQVQSPVAQSPAIGKTPTASSAAGPGGMVARPPMVHSREESIDSGVKVAGHEALLHHQQVGQDDDEDDSRAPEPEEVIALSSHAAPELQDSPQLSTQDTLYVTVTEAPPSVYATPALLQSPHFASPNEAPVPWPTSPALATQASTASLSPFGGSSQSSPRRSVGSLRAVAGSLKKMRTLSRSFSRLSARSAASPASPSMQSQSHKSSPALSAESPSLPPQSPREAQQAPVPTAPGAPSATTKPHLPRRGSSLRGQRSSKDDTMPSKRPPGLTSDSILFTSGDDGGNDGLQTGHRTFQSTSSLAAPPIQRATWRKRLSSFTSSSSVATLPMEPGRDVHITRRQTQRRNSLKAKIGEAVASLTLPSSAEQSPLSRRQSLYHRGIGPEDYISGIDNFSIDGSPKGRRSRKHDKLHRGIGPQHYDASVERLMSGESGYNASHEDTAEAVLQDRFLLHHWRGQETVDQPVYIDGSSQPVLFPQSEMIGSAEPESEDPQNDHLQPDPFPSETASRNSQSLRRRANFSRLSLGGVSTGQASSLLLPASVSPYSSEVMQVAMGVRSPTPRDSLNLTPRQTASRKRSQSFSGYERAPQMMASHSSPGTLDLVGRRTGSQGDHYRVESPVASLSQPIRRPSSRQRPASMFPAWCVHASETQARKSLESKTRPTSVVVGPFALELPQEASAAPPRRSRRFSLPMSLDYKAAGLRSSFRRSARETVIARRSLRRHNVNLGVGISVPLQLSFAAGLAWNQDVDDERRMSHEQQRSQTHGHFVGPQWIDSLVGVMGDDEEVAASETVHGTDATHVGADEREMRKVLARKQSMALLEGRTASEQGATPRMPTSPSSSSVRSIGSSGGSSNVVAIGRWGPERKRRGTESVHYYASAVMANLHSMSQALLAQDIPSYISARSANSIISESRPTRIQAQTLSYLNRILDELLLFIVVSARSLATDRIKTDGLLKVLNNNVLAKDAVLEAELELRNYLQGKKAEGGRVPLGLSATSRWDGTEAFPVASAYMALRNRCQYYSTLGDREDDSVTGDQHIMSAEGRPIATITPGVSIYVTALLEFVGEYILQNVARVIERDNSDEAGLADLKAAIEEDEQLITMWRQMVVKQEVEKEMKIIALGSDRRVTRPWRVPEGDDYDEAATPARFRASMQQRPGTAQGQNPPANWASIDRGSSSVSGHGEYAYSESHSGNSIAGSSSAAQGNMSNSTNITTPTNDSTGFNFNQQQPTPTPLTRRGSVDKGLSGLFSGRRRGSFRNSEDGSGIFAKSQHQASQSLAQGHNRNDSKAGETSAEPMDDFEALMMSGQTMKVSLTPNRLRTIEVARQEAEAKKARQRPGTLNVSNLRSDVAAGDVSSARSPAAPSPVPSVSTPNEPARPSSRNSFAPAASPGMLPRRSTGRVSNPPSSYRGPDPPSMAGAGAGGSTFSTVDSALVSESTIDKMTPRDKRTSWTATKDMMELFNTSPPSPQPGSEFPGKAPGGLRQSSAASQSSVDGSIGKKGGMGGKMRALLGRRSNSGKDSPIPGQRTESRQSRASSGGAGSAILGDRPSVWMDSSSVGHGRERSSNDVPPSLMDDENVLIEESDAPEPPVKSAMYDGDVSAGVGDSPYGTSADPDGPDTPALAQTPTLNNMIRQGANANADSGAAVVASGAAAAAGGTAVTGLFEEDKSPSGSGSALEDSRPEGPPSRKIPYGRRASRDGVVGMNRTRSQRSSEGGAGHSGVYERPNGTSSALGYASVTRSPGVTSAGSRSASASGLIGVSADTTATHFPTPPEGVQSAGELHGTSVSTLRILAKLDRQMKLATSVQECRAIVAEALGDALRGVSLGEDLSKDSVEKEVVQPLAVTSDALAVVARPMPVLAMADDYDEDADEGSTAFKQNGLVASWLLEERLSSSTIATTPTTTTTAVTNISPSNSTGSRLDAKDHATGPGVRSRKLSSATTLDENMYASADEGDIEDEYESSGLEGPVLTKGGASAMATKHGGSHPPSASAAAIRAVKSGVRSSSPAY